MRSGTARDRSGTRTFNLREIGSFLGIINLLHVSQLLSELSKMKHDVFEYIVNESLLRSMLRSMLRSLRSLLRRLLGRLLGGLQSLLRNRGHEVARFIGRTMHPLEHLGHLGRRLALHRPSLGRGKVAQNGSAKKDLEPVVDRLERHDEVGEALADRSDRLQNDLGGLWLCHFDCWFHANTGFQDKWSRVM